MSATGGNSEKQLELIHKTYHLRTSNSNIEETPHPRSSNIKVTNHQPSRKTSVHDVQEATREEFNKTVGEMHEGLARLNGLLETMTSATTIRDEFGKLKLQLILKITEFVYRLTNDNAKKSTSNLKGSSSSLTFNPLHITYCIEHFRNQLLKAQYLFSSLTLSASIGSSTLDSIVTKSLSKMNLRQPLTNNPASMLHDDIDEIQKDITKLEEYMDLLNKRYSNNIPEANADRELPMTTGDGGLPVNEVRNQQQLDVSSLPQKLSAASSTTSIERSNFCARLYQKCQIVCCICTPNYL